MTEILPRVLLKNGKKADHRVMVKESKISFFFQFCSGRNLFLKQHVLEALLIVSIWLISKTVTNITNSTEF